MNGICVSTHYKSDLEDSFFVVDYYLFTVCYTEYTAVQDQVYVSEIWTKYWCR